MWVSLSDGRCWQVYGIERIQLGVSFIVRVAGHNCVLALGLSLCIRCASMHRVLLLDPEQSRDDSLISASFVDGCG